MPAGTCTDPNNLKQLGRPNFTYAESLVKFGLHLVALCIHKITFRMEKQTNKSTNGQLPNLCKDKSGLNMKNGGWFGL